MTQGFQGRDVDRPSLKPSDVSGNAHKIEKSVITAIILLLLGKNDN